MTVRVLTDSSADLPPDLAREWGIGIVPTNINFPQAQETFQDGVDIGLDEFFDRQFNGPDDIPKTSAPSIGVFEQAFESAADGADGVVSVNVSSRVSATVDSARQAAEMANASCPIEVVDGLQASMGTGFIALAAARAARDGASASEVAAVANGVAKRTQCFALLDTLEYLKRGGRIGGAQAMIGSILRIKPLIIVEGGVVDTLAKERTRRRGLSRLRRTAESFAPISEAAVMYSTSADEAERVAESIRPLMAGGAEPMVCRFGPTLGVYVGPGAIGIALVREPVRE